MGSSKGGSQTIGYKYFFGIHGGLGRGPVDEVVKIKVGDAIAWSGSITGNQTIQINQPKLFGGDKKEGGIVGAFSMMMGARDQGVLPALLTMLKSFVPAYRGTATWFYDGQVCSNNPYPKPWSLRVRRAKKGWFDDDPWYPGKAIIYQRDQEDPAELIYAMNPAHMLYECITNPEWGRGLPASFIDEVSFRSAANALSDEGLGLCLRWVRSDNLGEFMASIANHIAAELYVDRGTGLFTLRLLRADYDPDSLGVFDYNSGLLSVENDESGAGDNTTNEVIVKYHQQVRNEDRQVRVQNIASFQSTGAVNSTTVEYPGVSTADLATRLAQRELKVRSVPLKRFKLTLDRRGWKIAPGSVFKISAPDRNIGSMIVRAGKPQEADPTGNTITLSVVQDVFGLPDTAFVKPQPSLYVPPDTEAKGITTRTLQEITYRDLVRKLTAADLATVADDSGAIATVAARPSALSVQYEVWSKAAGETDFVQRGDDGDFAPAGQIVDAVGFYDTEVVLANPTDLEDVGAFPVAGLLGDEIVRIDGLDLDTNVATIARGCADTVPLEHDAGTTLFFYDDFAATDDREYVTGDDVSVRLLTTTLAQTLALDVAAEDTITIGGRQFRPYPPGDLQVNGSPFGSVPAVATVDVVLTWEHRNRVLAQDNLVEHGATGGSAEAGTTYNIRVYDGLTLLHSATGITGTTWTYAHADWITDGSPATVTIELEAERDSVVSWTKYSFNLDIS